LLIKIRGEGEFSEKGKGVFIIARGEKLLILKN